MWSVHWRDLFVRKKRARDLTRGRQVRARTRKWHTIVSCVTQLANWRTIPSAVPFIAAVLSGRAGLSDAVTIFRDETISLTPVLNGVRLYTGRERGTSANSVRRRCLHLSDRNALSTSNRDAINAIHKRPPSKRVVLDKHRSKRRNCFEIIVILLLNSYDA